MEVQLGATLITSLPELIDDADEQFDDDDDVIVALPENYEDGESILKWALNRFPEAEDHDLPLFLTHIHVPSKRIPLMGIDIDGSNLEEEVVDEYRRLQKEKAILLLRKYTAKCQKIESNLGVFKEMLVEDDDVAEGLLKLINGGKITKLVMGAASNSETKVSEKANKVMNEAPSFCKIWFLYRGELIHIRDSESMDVTNFSSNEIDGVRNNGGVLRLPNEDTACSSMHHEQGQGGLDAESELRFREVYTGLDNFKRKSNEEYKRRENDEKELFWTCQKAMLLATKMSNDLHMKDAQRRVETEQFLERGKANIDLFKKENEELKEKITLLEAEKIENLSKLTTSKVTIDYLEDRIATLESVVEALQVDYEKDEATNAKNNNTTSTSIFCSEFSLEELMEVTGNFSVSKKIGEGGFGCVYRCILHSMPVAVKVLNPNSLQDKTQFEQEVAILGKVRHRNIVTLIGACSKASALVYEYLPNGSLEDRLECKNDTPPLSWQTRTRIIGEICSALIFLHSNNPHPVVHGDLKPENILLDANLVVKLSDFGIAHLLIHSDPSVSTAQFYRTMNPKGTLSYMDPEYLRTGELTPKSDVYSLGIIILRLLTGKQPINIVNQVEPFVTIATDDELKSVIDSSAGDWPFVQARKLAYIGLQCANVLRSARPDLIREVWTVVEPLMKAASLSSSTCFGSFHDENRTPSYFVCPILQDIMSDPQTAADGFTYDAVAIRGWLDSGRNTSPMTNDELPNLELIPNRALRSAIQEWNEQHPNSQTV